MRFLLTLFLLISCFMANSQTSTCGDPSPLCLLSTYDYPLGSNIDVTVGNSYGCIPFTSVNSVMGYFYSQVRATGSIELNFDSDNNISVAAWGPFPDLATASGGCGDLSDPLVCSADPFSNAETITLNGSEGEFFLIFVKGDAPPAYVGQFSLTQTNLGFPNAGVLNCPSFTSQPISCPANLSVLECGDAVPAVYNDILEFVAAGANIDNLCTDRVSVTVDEYENGGLGCAGDPRIVERRYWLQDQCGNLATCLQQIAYPVLDEPLELSCPLSNAPTQLVTCLDELVVNVEDIVALNACGIQLSYSIGEPVINDSSLGIECDLTCLHYPITVTDECGRVGECTLSFTVYGNIPEFVNDISEPLEACRVAPLVVECQDDVDMVIENWLDTLSVFSTCGNRMSLETNFDADNFTNVCSESVFSSQEITITATDACGRTNTCNATLNLTKTEGPRLAKEAKDKSVSCSQNVDSIFQAYIADDGGAIAFDYCSATTFTTNPANPEFVISCDEEEGLSIEFIASDACGNTNSTIGVFTVLNDSEPTISVEAADQVVACNEDVDAAFNSFLTSQAGAEILACGNITWATNPALPVVPSFIDDCDASTSVDFIGTDECGHQIEMSATFSVLDTTPPVFTFVPTLITEDAIAEDLCSAVTITTMDVNSGNQIIRTYTATDACGNITTITVTFEDLDTTPPVITFIPEELGCDGVLDPNSIVATDDSGQVTISVILVSESGSCNTGYIYIYEVTATDAAGNTTTENVTYNIPADNTPPMFTMVPENLTFFCSEEVVIPTATATDECGEVVITCIETLNSGAVVDDCNNGYGYDIFKTWTATDACGNVTTAVTEAWVVPDDYIGPKFEFVPESMTMECGEDANFGEAICNTACGNVVLTHVDEILQGDCSQTGQMIRTWTGVDDCGNVTTAQQIITIPPDMEAPVFTFVPESKTIKDLDELDFGTPACVDNCATINHLNVEHTDDLVSEGCGIIRTWVVSDLCGNTAQASQTFFFDDTEVPTFEDAPASLEIECGVYIDFIEPTISDNMSGYKVTIVDESNENLCTGLMDESRTWIAVDVCGNESVFTQTIHTVDSQTPFFNEIATEIVISCNDAFEFDEAIANDHCSAIQSLDYIDIDLSDDNCTSCIYKVKRTWTAVDACGNEATISQTLSLLDKDAPSISLSGNVVMEYNCGQEITIEMPTAIDDCGDVSITFEDKTNENNCNNGESFTRTWMATDNIGNISTADQQFIFVDNDAPVFVEEVEDLMIQCGQEIPSALAIAATDNCQEDMEVSIEEVVFPEMDCANGPLLTRTYTSTDACGNIAVMSYSVYRAEDTTHPVLMSTIEDKEIFCGQDVEFDMPTFEDNCGSEVEISWDTNSEEDACSMSQIRTWTASDNCGNATEISQRIYWVDNEAPEILMPLTGLEMTVEEYLTWSAAPTVDMEDSCSGVNHDATVINATQNGDCENYRVAYSYTISDNCGNENQIDFEVYVPNALPSANMETPQEVDCGSIFIVTTADAEVEGLEFAWSLEDASNTWEILSINNNQIEILAGDDTAELELAVTNNLGCTSIQTQNIVCAKVNAVNELTAIVALELRPNPVLDQLTIQFQSNDFLKANFIVYDLLGRVILDQKQDILTGDNQIQINASLLEQGTYLLEIATDQGAVVKKFMKF